MPEELALVFGETVIIDGKSYRMNDQVETP